MYVTFIICILSASFKSEFYLVPYRKHSITVSDFSRLVSIQNSFVSIINYPPFGFISDFMGLYGFNF